ncbi:ABC transporter permease [Salinibacterium sp. SWN1162]|uniref:ABC transporter permease n=1 Tax=Salinibacterium sp. SWN1162 TaxID=2792053 RepID=UPI0027DBB5B0|nr:ABC transporter permease [Salinibacterium sp. SWN1162]
MSLNNPFALLERPAVTDVAVAPAPVEPVRSPRRRWIRPVLLGAVLPLTVIALWQIIATSGLVASYRLPTPLSVVAAGVDLYERGVLYQHVAISTQRVLLGFLIGSIVGLALASVVGLSARLSEFFAPTLGALRAVPSLAWVPLLGLYLGYNEDSKVALIAIGAFFPVYTTVASALRHVDSHLVELGRSYGYSGPALLGLVQLPAVVPAVISSLRLALAQAWLFLVAGELLGASLGLGFLLVDSQQNGRIDRLFLTIILLGVLGKLTDAAVGVLERFLLKRWGS